MTGDERSPLFRAIRRHGLRWGVSRLLGALILAGLVIIGIGRGIGG